MRRSRGAQQGVIVNLTDRRAEAVATGSGRDCVNSLGPDRDRARVFAAAAAGGEPAGDSEQPTLAASRHAGASRGARRATCWPAACTAISPPRPNRGPKDFSDLLLVPGVGARTVRASAMVAEVLHGAPYRFSDPARFSFAHGGKDRHPFPVPIKSMIRRFAC